MVTPVHIIRANTERAVWLPILLAALVSCAPNLDTDKGAAGDEALRPIARFDLETQEKLPWPNIVAQVRIGDDGEPLVGPLNLPNEDDNPLIAQVNQLTGFTQLPIITMDFTRPITTDSIAPGVNFFLVGVNPKNTEDFDNASTEVTVEFDEELLKLRIRPVRPLRPGFSYVAALTKSVKGTDGRLIQEDIFFRFMKFRKPLFDLETGEVMSDLLREQGVGTEEAVRLEQVRRLYQQAVLQNPLVMLRVRADLARIRDVAAERLSDRQVSEHLAVATAFVTATYPGGDPTALMGHAVSEVLGSAAAGTFPGATTYPAAAFVAANALTIPHSNISYIAFGVISSLDFRQADGTWPLSVTGAGTPFTVTTIMTYPKQVTQGPVPVVIFQHGITLCKNRVVLAVADSFAQAGMAVVGIDMVEHGDRTRTNVNTENDTATPGTCDKVIDGKTVTSGEGFVRIDILAVTRDALRQSAVDEVALAKALTGGTFNAIRPGGDFVTAGVTFVGMSLGGMVGSIFMAEQDLVNVAVLNTTGIGLANTFIESRSFGPPLLEAIAESSGTGPVTSERFQDFLTKLGPLVQGLVDPAEPAYYLASDNNGTLLTADNSILLQEVINDPTVPNSSSEAMAQLLELPLITAETPAAERVGPFPFSAWTQFGGGSHGVLLTPDSPANPAADTELLAVTTAMREQLLTYLGSFLQSAGTAISVLINE